MSTYAKLLTVLLRRPGLLPRALGAAWAFRARGWYRRAPFLPLPPREYVRWRMETAYGDPDAVPTAEELDRYLRWASAMRRRM
ncbi:MAG TPA: hypothetical protein VLL48_06620 [Longimicrobiales bacterium]|nr:hypothetical protein [Longimicrobiales bacterium]